MPNELELLAAIRAVADQKRRADSLFRVVTDKRAELAEAELAYNVAMSEARQAEDALMRFAGIKTKASAITPSLDNARYTKSDVRL